MRKRALQLTPALAAVLLASGFAGVSSAAACTVGAPLTDNVFTDSGPDCYIVPAGVESLRVTAVGGRGGDSYQGIGGGSGAIVQGTLEVHEGDEIDFTVGANAANAYAYYINTGGGTATRIEDLITAGAGGGAGGGSPGGYSIGGRGGSAGPGAGPGSDGGGGGNAGLGGRPGGYGAGGIGGAGVGGPQTYGSDGGFGYGGFGGGGYDTSGGNGGDGYYGGGGGGGATDYYSSSGGGGGGSSYTSSSVISPSTGTDASGVPQVVIVAGGAAAATTAPLTGLVFTAPQPKYTTSGTLTATITNDGTAPLRVDSFVLTGPGADDFFVSGDTCRHTLAVNGSCQVSVRFNPQATGPSSASLEINGNAPLATVALSGTGGALPTGADGADGTNGVDGADGANGSNGTAGTDGAAGATGATGAAGATGATGPGGAQGVAGKDGTNGKDGKDLAVQCTVESPVGSDDSGFTCEVQALKFKRTVKLTRNGKTVATGTQSPGHKLKLKVRKGMVLTNGTYGLVRSYRKGKHTVSQRQLIQLNR